MPAVPALLTAISDVDGTDQSALSTLQHIELSGTLVNSETVDLARHSLGAQKVTVHYGLTENGPAVSWCHDSLPPAGNSDFVSPGFPVPGAVLRICAPGSKAPICRGEAGEIHIMTPQLVKGYIGGAGDEAFYDDERGHWMITGDQGVMLEDGTLRVSGRYKDIIIRSGENIAPAQIEAVVNRRTDIVVSMSEHFYARMSVDSQQVQVVGATDDLMGEVPVAVVHGATSPDDLAFVATMPSLVVQHLGPTFAIDQVILLSDLGLTSFPQTATGKVRKTDLAARVREYREASPRRSSQDSGISVTGSQSSAFDDSQSCVAAIWSRILGVDKASLTPELNSTTLADSLTMMQVRRLYRKEFGVEPSLSDMLRNPTIAGQAVLLSQPFKPLATVQAQAREVAPTAFDMVEACGDELIAGRIQKYATPVLQRYGLDWHTDVENVIPMNDVQANMVTARRRLRSSLRRDAFYCPETGYDQLVTALKSTLTAHPMLRSLWFPSSTTSVSQAVVRTTSINLDIFIDASGHTVDTPEELSTIWYGDNDHDLCDAQRGPGALFRAVVFNVRNQPEAAGCVYWCNHAAFDSTSLSFVWETLEEVLHNRPVPSRTSYKLWADTLYTGRHGPSAQAGARYFSRKMAGFANLERSMIPRPRAPEFLEGNDDSWIDSKTGNLGESCRRVPLDGASGMKIANSGLTRVFDLPGLELLQRTHGIAAHTVLRGVLALANTSWTGTRTAFFRSLQSGRQWPFMDAALAAYLPSAADVDGPTLQPSFNIIHLEDAETTSNFLQRLKVEQENATKFECTPMSLAFAQLTETDRAVLMQCGLSQLFNWVPSNRHMDLSKVVKMQSEMNADTGLHWDFTHVNTRCVELYVRWDGCHLRKVEVESMLDDLEDIARWLSHPDHWNTRLSEMPCAAHYQVPASVEELGHAARSMMLSG